MTESFAVFRIIPAMRPANAQGHRLAGVLLLKSGFHTYEDAADWLQQVPADKLRKENLYEIKKTYQP